MNFGFIRSQKMRHITCFFLFPILIPFVLGLEFPENPDFYYNITELIGNCGYPVEEYEITTEDGYMITIFRIPHGKNDSNSDKKAMLLMHGLFGGAENYVTGGVFNSSLAFYLADHGYDVWLGNTRGNLHGRKHKTLSPSKSNFWKFSWHEIGLYDLPAMVDYILQVTGLEKIFYTGHSQGGTIFYVLNSLKPEYQKKFAQAFLMAPGGSQKYFKNNLLLPFAKNHKMLERMAENGRLYEIPPSFLKMGELFSDTCTNGVLKNYCEKLYSVLAGTSDEFDMRLLPIFMRFISTVSSFQMLHYAQLIDSGRFRQWDYGKKKNREIYGSPEPPDYPVEKIQVPTVMFYSLGDTLAHAEDVEDLSARIPGVIKNILMKNKQWTHIDFLVASHLEEEICRPILEYMNSFKDPLK